MPALASIRIRLPAHLRTLCGVEGEVRLAVWRDAAGQITQRMILDALDAAHPTLRGTIRDHGSLTRRPLVRFFACELDVSNDSPDAPLPEKIALGDEPFHIIGAIAGG